MRPHCNSRVFGRVRRSFDVHITYRGIHFESQILFDKDHEIVGAKMRTVSTSHLAIARCSDADVKIPSKLFSTCSSGHVWSTNPRSSETTTSSTSCARAHRRQNVKI